MGSQRDEKQKSIVERSFCYRNETKRIGNWYLIFIICLVLLKINWFSAYNSLQNLSTWKKYCNCQNTLKSKINYHYNTHLLCMPSLCCIIFCSFYLLPQLANCSFCEMQKDFNTSKTYTDPHYHSEDQDMPISSSLLYIL